MLSTQFDLSAPLYCFLGLKSFTFDALAVWMKLIFRIHLVFVFALRVSFQLMTKHLPNLDEVCFSDGSIPQHSFQGAKVMCQLTDLLAQIEQSALDLLLFLHLQYGQHEVHLVVVTGLAGHV